MSTGKAKAARGAPLKTICRVKSQQQIVVTGERKNSVSKGNSDGRQKRGGGGGGPRQGTRYLGIPPFVLHGETQVLVQNERQPEHTSRVEQSPHENRGRTIDPIGGNVQAIYTTRKVQQKCHSLTSFKMEQIGGDKRQQNYTYLTYNNKETALQGVVYSHLGELGINRDKRYPIWVIMNTLPFSCSMEKKRMQKE